MVILEFLSRITMAYKIATTSLLPQFVDCQTHCPLLSFERLKLPSPKIPDKQVCDFNPKNPSKKTWETESTFKKTKTVILKPNDTMSKCVRPLWV